MFGDAFHIHAYFTSVFWERVFFGLAVPHVEVGLVHTQPCHARIWLSLAPLCHLVPLFPFLAEVGRARGLCHHKLKLHRYVAPLPNRIAQLQYVSAVMQDKAALLSWSMKGARTAGLEEATCTTVSPTLLHSATDGPQLPYVLKGHGESKKKHRTLCI